MFAIRRQKLPIIGFFRGGKRLEGLVDEEQTCAASYVPSYVLLCEPGPCERNIRSVYVMNSAIKWTGTTCNVT